MQTSPDLLSRLAHFAQSVPGGEVAFTAVLFIVVLSVLVFVHELGHYLAARSVGIRVEAFSIGFGREVWGWRDRHGTRWKICWLPFGGYVQMFGQVDGQAYTHVGEAGSFSGKKIWQRAWVVLAGPAANVVFAFLLLIVVMLTGEHRLKAEVGATVPEMPAHGVLREGDVITALNGVTVEDWDAMQQTVAESGGKPLAVAVLRGGQGLEFTLTPQTTTFTDLLGDVHTVGRLGIAPSYATFVTYHGPAQAVAVAGGRTWQLTSLTVRSVYKLLIGAVSPENLTGPLGIANLTGKTAASGTFALLMFVVVISINLCIVNLFPLPVLDGGHLLFLGYEKVAGKPVGGRAQEWLFRFGLGCILALAAYSTLNDVRRLGLVRGGGAAAAAE